MRLDKYVVQHLDEQDITPEETLADALSSHSVVEIPIGRSMFRIFYTGVVLVLLLLMVQSFRLQVLQGKTFSGIAGESRLNVYPVHALRGRIMDRNGLALADNVPVFDLVAVRSELQHPP